VGAVGNGGMTASEMGTIQGPLEAGTGRRSETAALTRFAIGTLDMASSLSNNATPKDVAAYLCTPQAIRERCGRVHELAKQGKLHYFDYHPEKEKDVVEFCLGIIKVHLLL
jgi:hypothetical protein